MDTKNIIHEAHEVHEEFLKENFVPFVSFVDKKFVSLVDYLKPPAT